MASQGPNSPGTTANVSISGGSNWVNTDYVKTENRAPYCGSPEFANPHTSNVKIIKGGTIGATNLATSDIFGNTLEYVTYGSSTELWGETWAYTDINNTTFGFAFAVQGSGALYSNYLKVTNFGFTIPDSTINGISVEVKIFKQSSKGLTYTYIDHIRITVYYTEGGGGGSAIKSVNGLAKASVKSVNGLAIANVKNINGLA